MMKSGKPQTIEKGPNDKTIIWALGIGFLFIYNTDVFYF